MKRNLERDLTGEYENAFILGKSAVFQVVIITGGSTLKRRSKSHIYIPGVVYGGALGTMLCKTPWRNMHKSRTHESTMSLCEDCAKKLKALARFVMDGERAKELFVVAGGRQAILPITQEEALAALKKLRKWEELEKEIYTQDELPAEFMPTGTGKGTSPWQVPSMSQPSSTSDATTLFPLDSQGQEAISDAS